MPKKLFIYKIYRLLSNKIHCNRNLKRIWRQFERCERAADQKASHTGEEKQEPGSQQNMLNMFKSGLTKQGQQLAAHTVHTP